MALSLRVDIDLSGAVGFMRRLQPTEQQRRMLAAMRESVLWAQRRIVSHTPKKTGVLAASIGVGEVSAVVGVVRSPLHYAPFVEFGTRPHVIKPKHGKALFWPGAAHPVRSVAHPGTKGVFMFRDTAAESAPTVLGIFRRHLVA